MSYGNEVDTDPANWRPVRDRYGNPYVIPASRSGDWNAWLKLPESNPEAQVVPDYAKRYEGGLGTF